MSDSTTEIDLDEAKIYVGTYAKYNEGNLAGEWVELSNFSDEEEFLDHIRELHSDEEDPEYMYQDYENIPSSLISESSLSSDFWELKDASDPDEVAGIMDYMGMSVSEAINIAENSYGSFDSNEDFAENYMTEVMEVEIPSQIEGCVDWDRVWESNLRHYFTEINGTYYSS